jgi:hypothetical protein
MHFFVCAGMAELANALDLGSSEGDFLQVRVLLPAPPKCQAQNKKKFVLGLTYFYAHLPARSNSDTNIMRASRINAAKARNLPLNLDAVIRINQHPFDQ